jgi:hypothetical protein
MLHAIINLSKELTARSRALDKLVFAQLAMILRAF